MSKLRVYKVAEQLGMDNRALVALFQSLGIDEVRNHMSTVSADQVERAKRQLSRGDDDKMVEERLRSGGGGAGVIIRRKKGDEPVSSPDPTPPVRRPVRAPGAGEAPAVARGAQAPATASAGSGSSGAQTSGSAALTGGSSSAALPTRAQAIAAQTAANLAASASAQAAEVSAVKTVAEVPPVKAAAEAPSVVTVADVPPVKPAASNAAVAESGSPAVTSGAVSGEHKLDAPVAPETKPSAVSAQPSAPKADSSPVVTSAPISPAVESPAASEAAVPSTAASSSSAAVISSKATDAAPAVTEQATVTPSDDSTGRHVATQAKHAEEMGRSPKAEERAATPAREMTEGKAQAREATENAPRPVAVETERSVKGAEAPVKANPEASVPPVRRDPLHTDPIRRVGAPMGPAAAAAARAAERARASQSPSSERTASSQTPESRQQRSARPVANAPDPARPAPKTGIDVWEGRPGVPMPQAPRNSGVPRRVQYDTKTGPQGNQGPRRGPSGPMGNAPGGRGRPSGGPGGPASRRGPMGMGSRRPSSNAVVTQERAAHKKVVRIEGDISLQSLAAKMGVKAGEVLMKLMSLGVGGININSSLDPDTAKIVGEEFGWNIEDVAVSEDAAIAAAQGVEEGEEVDEEREHRPPVVTVMGHVDHGKTSLLDRIRKSSVAQGEAGGITQHIGAYSVKTKKGRVTFLDTPGHAAFTQMRARGAKCTDIVVLVVAADDGVMPQTREAVNHAKDAKCPIVVAVNKIDKPDAQPERVRRELSDVGLIPEEWGGETLFCEVSAHSGQGIDELLDAILLQAEVLDLKANPKRHARGTVIEAKLDRGQGPVATVLVTEGTLRKGDGILVGNSWGKVRAMLDENGRGLASAGPSTPVAVIGLNEVPSAGDMVDAVQDAKKAQQIAEQRRDKLAERSRSTTSKVSLEELARRMNQSDQKDLKLIIKGDVQGSVEALTEALTKLSTDKVRVTAVHAAVGAITEGDVNLAVAAKAIILGFNARPAGKASILAVKEGVEIRQYSVIYDATDDVLATMQGLLAPTLVEEAIGEAEVRKIFKVSKAGVVAGCMVTNGVVRRSSFVRLRRAKDVIWEGKIESLKRFKDDAKEVREGFDCGISFSGFNELQEGDIIAAFEMKEVRPTL